MRRFRLILAVLAMFSVAGRLSGQTEIRARAARITFGGWLQTQYAESSVEAYTDQFLIRRARVNLDFAINDFFDARFQQEFAGGGGATLRDAWVRFNFSPQLRLSMGQFKRAFDLFELASPTDLSLIERDGRVGGVDACSGVGGVCSYSRFTERLGLSDRDLGLRVQGTRGRVSYEGTLTNGAGANAANTHEGKSYSGRVTFELSEGLTLGGQGALHDYAGPNGEDRYAPAWAFDIQRGTWRDGLLLQASLVRGDNWRTFDASGDAVTFTALQAVASWYVPVAGARLAGVEPLMRVSWADPDGDAKEDGGTVFTPGFMLYVSGKNKVGFNLDVWAPQAGDTEYSLKVQSFLYF